MQTSIGLVAGERRRRFAIEKGISCAISKPRSTGRPYVYCPNTGCHTFQQIAPLEYDHSRGGSPPPQPGGVAITGAAAAAGAKAESGAATDGAITNSDAEDGGEDAGAAVGATAAGRGGLTTEEAMAAAEGALALVGGTGTGTVGAGTIESGRGTEGATGNASAEEEGAWEEAAASVRACIVA